MLKSQSPGSNNTVENALIKYNGLSSITEIKKNYKYKSKFSFQYRRDRRFREGNKGFKLF